MMSSYIRRRKQVVSLSLVADGDDLRPGVFYV